MEDAFDADEDFVELDDGGDWGGELVVQMARKTGESLLAWFWYRPTLIVSLSMVLWT